MVPDCGSSLHGQFLWNQSPIREVSRSLGKIFNLVNFPKTLHKLRQSMKGHTPTGVASSSWGACEGFSVKNSCKFQQSNHHHHHCHHHQQNIIINNSICIFNRHRHRDHHVVHHPSTRCADAGDATDTAHHHRGVEMQAPQLPQHTYIIFMFIFIFIIFFFMQRCRWCNGYNTPT